VKTVVLVVMAALASLPNRRMLVEQTRMVVLVLFVKTVGMLVEKTRMIVLVLDSSLVVVLVLDRSLVVSIRPLRFRRRWKI
jgi:hypothetical protein